MLLNFCIHVLHLIAHLSPQNNGHPPNIGEEEMDNLIWDHANEWSLNFIETENRGKRNATQSIINTWSLPISSIIVHHHWTQCSALSANFPF